MKFLMVSAISLLLLTPKVGAEPITSALVVGAELLNQGKKGDSKAAAKALGKTADKLKDKLNAAKVAEEVKKHVSSEDLQKGIDAAKGIASGDKSGLDILKSETVQNEVAEKVQKHVKPEHVEKAKEILKDKNVQDALKSFGFSW